MNSAVLNAIRPILSAPSVVNGTRVIELTQRTSITPPELQEALGILAPLRDAVLETGQQRAVAWLEIELGKLAQADLPLEERRARRDQMIAALRDGTIPAKKLAPGLLHVTEFGGLVFMGLPTEDGKARNVVMRTVPWVTKELFAIGGAILYLVADARLRIGTGRHETDTEFLGYRARFIDGRQANVAMLREEVARYRRLLQLSYEGERWNSCRETIAQFYPPDAASMVPDLRAEAAQLKAPYSIEDEGGRKGIWNFETMERGGGLAFEDIDILHRGDGLWSLFEGGSYLGDVNYSDHPIRQPEVQFMEEVIAHPDWDVIRYGALVEGRPTFVSLGGGSGFTEAKASSHLKIDTNGDVIIWDPNVEIVADLARLGIPLHRVKHIVVSHAHFDHVAGFWQLIRRLPHKPFLHIQTNPDDMNHIRSGRSITPDMEMSMLMTLVDMAVQASGGEVTGAELLNAMTIVPMRFLQDTQIGTYTVQFFHSNHSLPTTPYFVVDPKTGRPAFLFTGDARLDAEALFKAVQAGAMTPDRARFLSSLVPNFLLQGAVVVGDAGVPPLHPTPAYYQEVRSILMRQGLTGEALEEVMSHLYGYHEDRKKVAEAGLNHVGWGWGTAIDLSVPLGWVPPRPEEVNERLLNHGLPQVPLFANLTARDLEDLKGLTTIRRLKRGEVLMRQGDPADSMMVILDGAVGISRETDQGGKLSFGTITSGLVGEGVFAEEKVRNASVEALTDVIVAELGRPACDFLRGKGVAAKAVDLRQLRRFIDGSDDKVPILTELHSDTRDRILLSSRVENIPAGTVMMHEGERGSDLYFILDGEVRISTREGPLSARPVIVGRGDVIGEGALMGPGIRGATVTALSDVQCIRLSEARARQLLDELGGDLNYFLLGVYLSRTSRRD